MAHIDEEILDRYAIGTLASSEVPAVEEHLLICAACQDRLTETDDFVAVFRTAATQVMAHPQSWWKRVRSLPGLAWTGAALAGAALAIVFVAGPSQRPSTMPAMVVLHAMRGPESAARMASGRPATLVFPGLAANSGRYDVQIVDADGETVRAADAQVADGRATLAVGKLRRGRYWVRLFERGGEELIAEYGLSVE
jgi:hypothetical protein